MNSRPFLIPVGAAVAALFPGNAPAAVGENETIAKEDKAPVQASKPDIDSAVAKMLYQIGPEEHALVLKKAEGGNIYAQHYSHSSHGSHGSHSSHRSGY
jgi:hypothetical protein